MRSLGFAPIVLTSALAFSAIVWAGEARADVGSADELFNEGRNLMKQGKITEACTKFEASFSADPGLGALLNLADCLERDGRLAAAYGRWGDAIGLATTKKDSRLDYIKERREALKPKLAFLTLTVVGSAADLDVYKGSTKLLPGAYGTALPTTPGETVIQVVRNGDQVLWESRVKLAESEQKTVTVPLGEIAAANPAPVKVRQDVVEQRQGSGGDAPEGFWSTQRIAGFVVGGGGVLLGGVGFIFGGLAADKASVLDAECTDGETRYCTDAGQAAAADANTFANASTWTLISAGIVVAIGITVIATAPNDYTKLEERAFVVPWVTPEGGGLVAAGVF
ncbi:MAG: hypothetical protein U0271_21345 [Polyangiaceae bacterium]